MSLHSWGLMITLAFSAAILVFCCHVNGMVNHQVLHKISINAILIDE